MFDEHWCDWRPSPCLKSKFRSGVMWYYTWYVWAKSCLWRGEAKEAMTPSIPPLIDCFFDNWYNITISGRSEVMRGKAFPCYFYNNYSTPRSINFVQSNVPFLKFVSIETSFLHFFRAISFVVHILHYLINLNKHLTRYRILCS